MRFGQSSIRAGPAWQPVIVNVVGGLVACAVVAGGIRSARGGFFHPDSASAELRALRVTLADRSRDLAALDHELGKQEVLLAERKTEFAASGAPPARTPVEDDLRTITKLARRHDLQLAEVTPLGSALYPGAREVRYRIRGRGRYADLTKMLTQFEVCDFWGDITHLQVGRPKNSTGPRMDEREMTMTVSFYSTAASSEEPSDTQ